MDNNKKKTPKKRVYNDKEYLEEADNYVQRSKKQLKGFFSKSDIEKSNIVLSEKQLELYKMIRNNDLTVCQGPAGTSKTFIACYTALNLLVDKKIDKIIITKPIQEAGENLGFIPGSIDDKIEPYARSFYSNFEKIIGSSMLEFLKENKIIEFSPLAYIRGDSLDNTLMILDEAQNCTMKQLMLWVTRIGRGTKGIVLGDRTQYDIKIKDVKISEFINHIVKDVDGVGIFEFDKNDIVRNKFLIQIVDNYEKYLTKNER